MKQQELLNKLGALQTCTTKTIIGFAAVSRDVNMLINGILYANGDDIEGGLDLLGASCEVVSELLTEYAEALREATNCMLGGDSND